MILQRNAAEPMTLTRTERLLLLSFTPVCELSKDIVFPHVAGSKTVVIDFTAPSPEDLAKEA